MAAPTSCPIATQLSSINTLRPDPLALLLILILHTISASPPASDGSAPKLAILSPTGSPPPLSPACNTSAVCVAMASATCLGQPLPYTHTYLGFAHDSTTEQEIQEKLRLWSGLQNVPKCWEVVQPLLCAVYMPRCDNVTNTVELPARELCQITREPCKIVESVQPWPSFLRCNQTHFVSGCKNKVKTIKFNTTGRCMPPLVPTNNRNSWYMDVEGCGIQCQNPLFTDDEHRIVRVFIAVFAGLCLMATLFAILTFAIDWKNANRYPALILFFINICFFIGSIGWVIQFFPGVRQDIVCRHDGTVRQAEPQIGSGETVTCSLVFVLVYFSMMAGVTWFLVLSYVWHLTFQALGSPQDAIEGKKGTFHMVAWSVPLVLTIVCLALTQVDGESVSGICFVGSLKHEYRGGFVLLPISAVVAGGLFFLTRGLVTLIKMKLETPGLISDRASAKIRDTIIRIGLFAGLSFLLMLSTCLVHIYIFVNEPTWHKAFQDFVISTLAIEITTLPGLLCILDNYTLRLQVRCETNRTVSRFVVGNLTGSACVLATRPSLVAMVVHILLFFIAGITMSSWVWTAATATAWKRFFKRLFRIPTNEPIKLKKHLMIRQAFDRRHDIRRHGRFEFSFHSTHDDPLGMKMDLNSATSAELSSAWAQAIPRMISRRGAFAHPTKRKKGIKGNTRRYSDSDLHSFQTSVQRTSVESRCYSVEAEQQTEVEDLRKKPKKRRGKNRVVPLVTTTPPAVQHHALRQKEHSKSKPIQSGPLTTGFLRRTNRVGIAQSNNSNNNSTGSSTVHSSQRRGSVTGSDAGSDHNNSLEPQDSSDNSYSRGTNTNSKRNSLASVELPAVTLPPPQYQHHIHQHHTSIFTTTASTYSGGVSGYSAGGLPGAVPGAYEMNNLAVDMEPTFTSVTPIDTELQSTPPIMKRRRGRRSSAGSARSASSGYARNRSSHRDRAVTRRFVVHTPKAVMNVGNNESDDCSEISA